MPAVSRYSDSIIGVTASEHSGHDAAHGGLTITGNIQSAMSPNVNANGLAVAIVGTVTIEHDGCCGTSYGKVAQGSPNVMCNGKPLARIGDALAPHNGTAHITGGSPNIFVNGG